MPMELVTQLPYDHPYRWDGSLFGGPVLWRPSALGSSLALWLDAEDLSTITLNASTVSQWSDKSGNSRHVTQATALNQPTWLPTGNGTKPALQFGANSAMNSAAFTVGTTSSTFVVLRPNSLGSGNRDYITSPTGNVNAHILYHQNTVANGLYLYSGGPLASTANALTLSTWGIAAGITNGVSSQVRSNGNIVGSGNAGGQTWSGGIRLGVNGVGTTYCIADYSEVVVASGAISASDREKLEGYLAWKWNMSALLPAGHPFKSFPPTM